MAKVLTKFFRGAVLSQLPREAIVVSNQATRHYGVDALDQWEDERDKGQTKHLDASTGVNRVQKVFHLPNSFIADD